MATKKADKKAATTKKVAATADGNSQKLTADALPRRSLEKALEVATTLRQVFAGKPASFAELARNMNTTVNNTDFKYAVWSAVAYGIVAAEGSNQSRTYSLAEAGRKIVAENYPGEAQEARVKAILTPTVLSKFYTDYNGSPIPPPDEHFANVLEDKFHIPRSRTGEAIDIIKENGKFAGILEERGDGSPPTVRLTNVPAGDRTTSSERGAGQASNESGSAHPTGWDKICFFITPIGEEGSEERRHANMMLNHVVRPVFEQNGFTVVRADEIAKTGLISQQIFDNVAKARICVADLSFHNPNAFLRTWSAPRVPIAYASNHSQGPKNSIRSLAWKNNHDRYRRQLRGS